MVALLVWTCAVAPNTGDAKKQLDLLQGRWLVVATEEAGRYSHVGDLSQVFITIKDELLIFRTGKAERPGLSYRLIIVRPGEIDLLPNDKPLKGKRFQGIYKIEGDKLTICHAMGDPDEVKRPTEFKTKKDPNDPYMLYVLKRIRE